MRKVSYLSYNMTTADANNPDGIVPVGRQFDFIGDVETEEMILVDGDESLCLGYEDVKIYQDVYVGCLLYTSDAADEEDSGDLGVRRIIKKKKERHQEGTEYISDDEKQKDDEDEK